MGTAKYLSNLVKRANGSRRFVTERPSMLLDGGDLVELARSLLRFAIERPSVAEDEAERGRCPVCNWPDGTIKRRRRPECRFCGWPMNRRGAALKKELSNLVRRARHRDPWLVARVKAELPWLPDDVVCEQFTGPLAWLGYVWRRAGKPPGRPFDPTRHYGIVTVMEMLMRTHTLTPAKGGEVLFDSEINEERSARPGEVMWSPAGYALTFTEAARVIAGYRFGPGEIPPRRDGVPRPVVPTGETLNAIGKDFLQRLGYPARREEIIRSLRWARRQRTSAEARYAGIRVRARGGQSK